jgi:hypothetical protein
MQVYAQPRIQFLVIAVHSLLPPGLRLRAMSA